LPAPKFSPQTDLEQRKYDIDGVVGLDQVHDLVLLQINGSSAPSLSLGESTILAIGREKQSSIEREKRARLARRGLEFPR
jgi:hypothetical protein